MATKSGYYSIASGRWISAAEVRAAETAIQAFSAEATARNKRREATEALADAAAARGDFAEARRILKEGP
jgi:hypothetical protein